MASTNIIVKITHGTEIRRFTATLEMTEDNKYNLTWAALSKRVAEFFELPKLFKLTYVDDEGDRITLSSDAELHEAVTLALAASPAVLRLGVYLAPVESRSTGSSADVPMSDAATEPESKSTADAGTNAKPSTADAATHGEAKPNTTESSTGTGTPHGPHGEEVERFIQNIASQLPGLAAQLPATLRAFLPHAEIDLAATLAANQGAHAAAAAASFASNNVPMPEGFAPMAGAHPGVRCDKSGACPIVGNRYNLVGHNYDLCEAEFDKLPEREKALYVKIPPPAAPPVHNMDNTTAANAAQNSTKGKAGGANADPYAEGIHPGVECDRSGMCPIVGIRYNLKGHNYDLCQAEFDKLASTEKLLYTPIPPRAWANEPNRPWNAGNIHNAHRPAHGPGGFGHGWARGPFAQSWCGPPFHRPHGPPHSGPPGMGCGGANKLAARFVRDVAVFDGTQMESGTNFTKIWRLKNSGEVPWPPGTRMLFVGGDQMTTEMSVPLSRTTAVMPGEEVDVAVEMKAPVELGRYLGYWRLMGPRGRKFGQRVWCHVQVVDPTAAFDPVEMEKLAAEIEKKKSDVVSASAEEDAGDDDDKDDDKDDKNAAAPPAASADENDVMMSAATAALSAASLEPPQDTNQAGAALTTAEAGCSTDCALSDVSDSIVVTEGMAMEACDTTAATTLPTINGKAVAATEPDTTTPAGVKAALASMGFDDEVLVDVAMNKHGVDLVECAKALAAASEWDPLLEDLEEMGFGDRDLNKTLMLKNDGNIKRTVKALVEDA